MKPTLLETCLYATHGEGTTLHQTKRSALIKKVKIRVTSLSKTVVSAVLSKYVVTDSTYSPSLFIRMISPKILIASFTALSQMVVSIEQRRTEISRRE